jgi:hypothetical protein
MNPSIINSPYVKQNRNPPNNGNMFTNIQSGANTDINSETVLNRI